MEETTTIGKFVDALTEYGEEWPDEKIELDEKLLLDNVRSWTIYAYGVSPYAVFVDLRASLIISCLEITEGPTEKMGLCLEWRDDETLSVYLQKTGSEDEPAAN